LVINRVSALSPLDGRYHQFCAPLTEYFSEWGYFRYRLKVEVEYLLALEKATGSPADEQETRYWRSLCENFGVEECMEVKEIEQTTRHDVKALEYYLRRKILSFPYPDEKLKKRRAARVHFGLTSQDANNVALSLMLRDAINDVWRPAFLEALSKLEELSRRWINRPMLARTHGQPASPVTLGKELKVFFDRLQMCLSVLDSSPHRAKFGGATGNFNAHCVVYPDIRWDKFADDFLKETFGLQRYQTTTQIDPYDSFAEKFDALKRINVVLMDFCRDVWHYISLEYFKLKIRPDEVGSSAMPHKVNPIDFENAEGNLGLANAFFTHLSEKLPVSRLQRDLSDSTVTRNIGVPLGHTLIALKCIAAGLDKLELNDEALDADLTKHPEVLAEAVQTMMRAFGDEEAYEKLKALSRTGKGLDIEELRRFVRTSNLPHEAQARLLALEAKDYIGLAGKVWDE
jgi:adenylosuccinate lyase